MGTRSKGMYGSSRSSGRNVFPAFLLLIGLAVAGCTASRQRQDVTPETTLVAAIQTTTNAILAAASQETETSTVLPISTPGQVPSETPRPAPDTTPSASATPTTTSLPDAPLLTASPSPTTATASPSATQHATSSVSAPTAHPPVITFFEANTSLADPGDTIVLMWQTSNTSQVTLYRLMSTGQFGEFWNVDTTGSFTVTIRPFERNAVRYMLYATDPAGGPSLSASVTVALTCPDVWFFEPSPDGCPATSPRTSSAAEQTFERGRMVWVADPGTIYVLFADGNSPHWKPYQDRWREGDLESDPSLEPPEGLSQPIRGFGLLWRSETGVRDRLGWATSLESGFTTKMQSTSRAKYNDFYLLGAHRTVWRLLPEGSSWEAIPIAE